MLFRKKVTRVCMHCLHCTIENGEKLSCKKRGEVSADFHCIWFRYDPCKRVPSKMKALDTRKYEDTDFSL